MAASMSRLVKARIELREIPQFTQFLKRFTLICEADRSRHRGYFSLALRDDPEKELVAKSIIVPSVVARQFFVRFPIAHLECIRYDPRAGFQIVEQFGPEFQIDAAQQKKVTTLASWMSAWRMAWFQQQTSFHVTPEPS